ncbi:MAG: hypothetical protein RR277_08235, partial [Rikenellaceae bacterium]
MRKSDYIILYISLISVFSCVSTSKTVTPNVELPNSYMFDTLASYDIYEGKWWAMFGDIVLDSLEEVALRSSKNLQQTILAVEQSRLRARNIKSDMLPSLDLNATTTTTGSGDSKEK